jgi:hypothetical protein
MIYTFRIRGEFINVKAPDEATARHKVMVQRHGEPTGIYAMYEDKRYRGQGLDLISARPEQVVQPKKEKKS